MATQGNEPASGTHDEEQVPATPTTPYGPDNTREDGSYKVGRGRPPEHSRFRAGDERKRGRRSKGQPNFDTDLLQEAGRRMTVRENGKARHVTKQRATIIRAFDSALGRGDHRAASLLFSHLSRVEDKHGPHLSQLSSDDDEQLNAWLCERLALIEVSEGEVTDNPDALSPPSAKSHEPSDDK